MARAESAGLLCHLWRGHAVGRVEVPARATGQYRALSGRLLCAVPGGQPIWLDSDDYCETVGESKRDYFSLAPQASDLTGSSGSIDTDKHSHFLLSSKTYRADSTVSGKIGYKAETATKLPQGLQIYLTAYNKAGKKLQTVSALPTADGSFVLALPKQSDEEVYLVLSMTATSSNFDKQFEKLELTSLRINGGK
ncbi:MAG: hypothetical protein BWY75_03516 [bacterium ADurb.Bin425]|nr:MAG: hypothetical protein BWY75_03516 [bacterium ADurb.Bin425]